MKNQGWVKIHRQLLSNPIWELEPFTKGQAWVDLLLLANHTVGKISIRGNIIEVKRGQVGWSEVRLSQRWKWSRGKTRRYLKWLEKEQQIVQQKSPLSSVVTLLNYDKYQADSTADSTADGQQTVQQTDSRRYTNKNVKKEKNEERGKPNKKSLKYLQSDECRQRMINKFGEISDYENIVEKMCDNFSTRGKPIKDYPATFRNWIKREIKWKKEKEVPLTPDEQENLILKQKVAEYENTKRDRA